MIDVLLVEDDDDILETMTLLLELHGYSVARASDGADAFGQLSNGLRPRLVLLDLMMPRMTGSDLLQAMRTDPSLASIPVVIVSGDGAAQQQAAALHADGCLSKPVELPQLLAIVRRFVPESPQPAAP